MSITKKAITGLALITALASGCFKERKDLPKYTPFNAPRAHTKIGEDVVDADGDGRVDYIVKSTDPSFLRLVLSYREGYDKKAKELGYILTRDAKKMDNQTDTQAQLLFNASEGYRFIRGHSK